MASALASVAPRVDPGPVAIAEVTYPFPSRTRKSSPLAPMVLLRSGRVGSCRTFFLLFINALRKIVILHILYA
jgi:hypothetical protein